MNLVRLPLWPAALAGGAFAVLHAVLQWLRGGPADPALAVLSGLAVALAWLGPSVWALSRVGRPPQRWTLRQTKGTTPGPATGDRFDKFTQRARSVLQYAQEEAQRLHHNYIGTEHILLGLVRESDGVAARILVDLGIDLNTVRSSVELVLGRGQPVAGEIGLTPRARKVIELAVEEARRLKHHYVGTEHLLLGLVREGEGIAADILQSHGVSLDRVREQVIEVLKQTQMPPRPPVQHRVVTFGEGARRALHLAQEEATRVGHGYTGTEHVLVALLAEGHGLAALALGDVGLGLDRARQELARLTGAGEGLPTGVQVGLTAQAKRMIELATQAAVDRHAQEVGTEHLLVGLLAVDDAAGVRLLERLGTSREATLAALERRMR
jgi:ATP-dependent Clp protease ATP-binding subunit ClpA